MAFVGMLHASVLWKESSVGEAITSISDRALSVHWILTECAFGLTNGFLKGNFSCPAIDDSAIFVL